MTKGGRLDDDYKKLLPFAFNDCNIEFQAQFHWFGIKYGHD